MPQDDFAFAVARVAVVQALRKSGFDKAQPGVVNACTGLVTRYLAGLGRHAQQAAMQERRTDVQVTDVRQALENMGVIPPVDDARAAIGPFAAWLESDDFLDHERIQGVVDPLAVTEPAEKLDDWLTLFIRQQMKQSSEDYFDNTVLGTHAATENFDPVIFGSESASAAVNRAAYR